MAHRRNSKGRFIKKSKSHKRRKRNGGGYGRKAFAALRDLFEET